MPTREPLANAGMAALARGAASGASWQASPRLIPPCVLTPGADGGNSYPLAGTGYNALSVPLDAAPIRAMSGVPMSTQAAAAVPQKTPLLQSRLGSFLAVVPLSIWVVNHLWDNLAAFQGAEAWQSSVTQYKHPYAQIATFLIVILPLLFHTGWGVVRLLSFRPNNAAYPYYSNLKYILQRAAGVALIFFLGAHMWLAFLHPRLVQGHAEPFADIAREMHFHPPTITVYVLGVLATAYHIANGLQGFAMGWGLLASERSMRRFEPWSIVIFLVLLAMGWGAIFALYRAGAAYG